MACYWLPRYTFKRGIYQSKMVILFWVWTYPGLIQIDPNGHYLTSNLGDSSTSLRLKHRPRLIKEGPVFPKIRINIHQNIETITTIVKRGRNAQHKITSVGKTTATLAGSCFNVQPNDDNVLSFTTAYASDLNLTYPSPKQISENLNFNVFQSLISENGNNKHTQFQHGKKTKHMQSPVKLPIMKLVHIWPT